MVACLENAFHSDSLFSSSSSHLDCSAHIIPTRDPNPIKNFPLETTLLKLFNDTDCIKLGPEPIKLWPREADLLLTITCKVWTFLMHMVRLSQQLICTSISISRVTFTYYGSSKATSLKGGSSKALLFVVVMFFAIVSSFSCPLVFFVVLMQCIQLYNLL